jgi:5-methylcytosine-specific restriction protein A
VTLSAVTRDAVLEAVAEFDRVGRDKFLETAGFGRAKYYFLDIDGKYYDSKAIVGYAHGVSGDRPWHADDFTGGDKVGGHAVALARLQGPLRPHQLDPG